ncbi:MAG: Asp-tRNA(Asn)/Glu-tRNA(Gln) amidotransferase subunit GatB, partial [Clostridia bacterium]|nr:Asp-tRNA(Asn)/Glu-tRNA(Gln) amidotransferase subunit GatB [Clostridia bacterium]
MKYEAVIGIEVHAELSTDTKIYCSCANKFGGEINTHCCPVCTGMPGTLPVLNGKVVDYAIKAGLAMNCDINKNSKQDRKNYFYPDLPKAYQISQFDLPLCKDGYIDITVDGEKKRIGVTRIHIEEDAGKLMHDVTPDSSLIDYNRCGVPLIEIVSEPDMRSAKEAEEYLNTLKAILQYINVSDCKMQEGSLRCDVNVSVRPVGQKEYGVRSEMKNVSTFSGVLRGIDYEINRHIEILEAGGTIEQETRRWDDGKGISVSLRSKEDAHDYRYFPEPDLMPIVIADEKIEKLKNELPELPHIKRDRYIEQYGLPEYDATQLTILKSTADFFESVIAEGASPKAASNWIMGDIWRIMNEKYMLIEDLPFSAKQLADMIALIESGTISNTAAKQVIENMFETAK